MAWYPWLSQPYRQLVALHQAGRGHHALLLHAVAGSGHDTLMYALSRWLLCQQRQGEKSCGQCHACHLMLSGHHPDWHVLATETDKTHTGIDAVRRLIDTLYSHAQQGGEKVVCIPQPALLTEAAANALLKTLEEPPERTYFLLTCSEPGRLLATLRSRCFCWHLPCPPASISLQWLSQQAATHTIIVNTNIVNNNIANNNIEINNIANNEAVSNKKAMLTALRLHQGAPLAAWQLLQPECWQQRSALCQTVTDALTQRDLLSGLLSVLNHDNVAQRLHWLSSLLLDALKWQQGAGAWAVNQDQQALIAQLAQSMSGAGLVKLAQRWGQCRHQLITITGINRDLLLTDQIVQWENLLFADPAH